MSRIKDIKQRFFLEYNTLMGGREELFTYCRLVKSVLCDCSKIGTELESCIGKPK